MAYIGKVTDTAGNTHLVGSTLYGTCDTGASTATKVVTCPNFSKLETGVTIHVYFSNTNTASMPQLNVNSTGAKYVYEYRDSGTSFKYADIKKGMHTFTYNGTYWFLDDCEDTKNTAGSEQDTQKLYLIGAPSQTTGLDEGVRTYSNNDVWEEAGVLFADGYNGVTLSRPGIGGYSYEIVIGDVNGLTSLTIPDQSSYTLGDACEKGVDTSVSSSATNSNVPTSLAVYNAIQNAITGVAEYKGSVSAESSLLNTALTKGWYYIVAMPNAQTSSITIGGKTCEAGDMVWIRDSGTYTTSSSLGDHIDVIQANIDTLTNTEITTIWTNAVPVS